jgi:hypothetical protein
MNVERPRWFETRWRWWIVAIWIVLVANGFRIALAELRASIDTLTACTKSGCRSPWVGGSASRLVGARARCGAPRVDGSVQDGNAVPTAWTQAARAAQEEQ